MSVYSFDRLVRPYLIELRIGIQGVAFDRFDLDKWADHHKTVNGRPAQKEGLWLKSHPASISGAKYGGLKKPSKDMVDCEKALEQVISTRRSGS
jgi:hypothetical protein